MYRDRIIKNFLSYLTSNGVSNSSLRFYKSDIVNFLNWANGRKVNKDLVNEYINSQRLITPVSTLNRRLSTIRSFASYLGDNFMDNVGNLNSFKKVTRSWQEALLSKFENKPKLKNIFSKLFFSRPNWYKKYHSYALSSYLHFAILILFASTAGYATYDQFFSTTNNLFAFPSALTRPNRYLSFQGRLTDDLGNPETVATNVVFKLYDVSSGGVALWDSGTCSITPDQDGIFSTLLGSSCGAEIASSVFSENAAIWLGVTVGADAEATPRIQIATVAYALNSETLQGFPAGTGTSTIPYINSSGVVVLANASPKIQSTSGTFAVEGQALTLTTPDTTNGSITINPDGTGTLNLTFEGTSAGGGANGFVNATNANITSGSLYSGTVASNATGYNFINFLSGASPTSKFSVDSTGLTNIGADLYVASGISTFGTAVSDGTIEATQFCTGDGETNCVTDFSSLGGGGSLFTDSGTVTYLTSTTDDLAIGGSTILASMFGLDESAGNFYFGYDNSANPTLNFEATDGDAGEFGFNTNDAFYFSNANVGIGETNPTAQLQVAGTTAITGGATFPTGVEGLLMRYSSSTGYLYSIVAGTGVRNLELGASTMVFKTGSGITPSEKMRLTDTGNLGIGTTGPDAKIDSLATSGEQLRLTYTDGSVYSGFTVDANGYLAIDPTGARIALDGSLQIGGTSPLAYSRFGTATTGHAGNITASDDLLISGDLELNGSLFLDSGIIANSAGLQTIVFSSTPTTTPNTLTGGNWLVENTTGGNVGQAALMVNQTFSGELFTASASGTTKFTIQNDGDVVFSNKLIDSYVTSGITLGATNETSLVGFGASSIVGALNELKSSNKYISKNDYLSWANHYKAKLEGTNPTGNETLSGLFFDTFMDSTKMDSVNSTSSGAIRVGDNEYRVGLTGNQTYNPSTTDNDGHDYLRNDDITDIYYYDRTKDSAPEVLVELGIDPNWYNGVTLTVATSSANYAQNGTIADKNPNLTPNYNGSLIKVTGTDSEARSIYITIKSPTTFDWTNYQGDAATGVTITQGAAQTLGSTGVSVTFTAANYNVGDVFKIHSWYIEPSGTRRGAKQQFPERSIIAATASSIDIIDNDTQKLWMSSIQGTNYALGADADGSPTAVQALNGSVYVPIGGASATGFYTLDFVHDSMFRRNATDYRVSDIGIVGRNAALTYNVINTTNTIITVTANDVAAAVIPNQPTQEVTVSGWGYIVGDGDNQAIEAVNLPYKFNSTPVITTGNAGYKDTTAPTSLSECANTAVYQSSSTSIANSSFNAIVRDVDGGSIAITRYVCYTWTAKGTVSPKQFVVVATGATSADGGTTIINETDGTKANIIDGSLSGAALWTTKVAIADNRLYNAVSSNTPRTTLQVYNGLHGLQTGSTLISYRNGYYSTDQSNTTWSLTGPVYLGATGYEEIKSLHVTPNTSTVNPDSNTIYIGTSTGTSVIQEFEDSMNNSVGGEAQGLEKYGSVKYYTKDYISEEMVGDIRGMWPFYGSGTIANGTNNIDDVSIKSSELTAKNANGTGMTYTSAVRGTGVDFDGTDDYFCSDTNDDDTCDADTDLQITGNVSYGAWVQLGSGIASNDYIFSISGNAETAATNILYSMYINAASGNDISYLHENGAGTNNQNTFDTNLETDKWYHLVFTRNVTTNLVSLFINGNLAGTFTYTTDPDTGTSSIFYMGHNPDNGTYLDGIIEDPFVTATELTADQIKNMYQTGYRALQSHGTGLGGGAADANQQLGYISTGTSSVGVVATDDANQYMYVGTNSTTLGALSKIQLNSDTNIKTYNSSANVPSGGSLLVDENINSIAVSHQLEAVGSGTVGIKSMSPDSNSTALTGSLFSKTQTLSSSTKFAYFWTSVVTDDSDANSAINVYACNDYSTKALCDSNNAWVLGTLIQTDTNQTPAEREYNFTFPNAGSYLTFKIDFKRGSTKTNTFIERYGASWSSSTGGADLAERYKSNEPVYPGDIVSITEPPVLGEATVALAKTPYDKMVIGIVTTNPGIVLDDNLVDLNFNAASRNSPDRPAVALSGRVPVKVSNINGQIQVGDAISSSDIAGVGIKATKAGNIVAKALEPLVCEDENEICEGKIMAFVNVSWFDPDAYLTETGDIRIRGYETLAEDGTTNVIYKIVRVAVNGAEEIINKIGIFKTVNTQDLATNIISPIADADLIIDLSSNQTASRLVIKGEGDQEVASIDASGSATFAGSVSSEDLLVNSDATVSGTLYADNIESQRLEDIEELLKEVELNQGLLAESQTWDTETSADSAEFSNLIASSLQTNDLFVTGQAAISSLFISDLLTTNKIESLDMPLQIQSLAAAPLEIMAGKITIDVNGNTKFLNNVEIAGDLKVNNIIIANNTEDLATESATIIEGEVNSNSTAGKAILSANTDKVRINNNKVSLNTLIYITPITPTQNKVLYVKAKDTGYFEVGFSDTLEEDVEFNWWIIDLENNTIDQQ